MAAKEFRHRPGLALFVSLHFLEEIDERGGVVTGLVEILQAQEVRFRLGLAAKAQEGDRDGEARGLTNAKTGPAAHEDERNRRQVEHLPLGGAFGAVPRGDVGDFMGHDAGEFRLAFRAQEEAGVDEEKTARQRERVHFTAVDQLDREGHLGVGVPHQILPHAIDVFGDHRVIDDLRVAFHVLRQRLAESDLLLERVEVHSLADLAVADRVNVFFLVLRLALLGLFRLGRSDQTQGENQRQNQGQNNGCSPLRHTAHLPQRNLTVPPMFPGESASPSVYRVPQPRYTRWTGQSVRNVLFRTPADGSAADDSDR